jgi:hypothetical protein
MRKQLWAAAALTVALAACSGGSKGTESPPLTVGVGGCCGDPTHCRSNLCADSLHCGASQSPTAVFVCCANGAFCCATDSDCQDHVPGGACNTATSTCYTSCATDDDTRCAAGYHCEGSTCLADVANGTGPCDEASDCASDNCSVAFDPNATTSICAPAGACANGNQSWPVGYTLCTGSVFSRRCDAAGHWSEATLNPYPANTTCDSGGGADSGFEPAAICTSSLDAIDAGFATTCTSCFPYRATASGCLANCANNDANCWAGYHCSAHAGNTCVSNAIGSSCDVDAECSSGRCSTGFVCADKVADNGTCAKSSDCTSGWCNGTVCATKRANNVVCAGDVECQSGHCSNDFDPASSIRYCAPAGTCARNGNAYPTGWVQCSAGATDSTYARTCNASGNWVYSSLFSASACDGGNGSSSGYTTPTCTSGNGATGITTVCHSCGVYAPNASYNACLSSCSGSNDAACVSTYYCNGSACVADLANNSTCNRDSMCTSGLCDTNAKCMAKRGDGQACTDDRQCASGLCYSGSCMTPLDIGAPCVDDRQCLYLFCDPISYVCDWGY